MWKHHKPHPFIRSQGELTYQQTSFLELGASYPNLWGFRSPWLGVPAIENLRVGFPWILCWFGAENWDVSPHLKWPFHGELMIHHVKQGVNYFQTSPLMILMTQTYSDQSSRWLGNVGKVGASISGRPLAVLSSHGKVCEQIHGSGMSMGTLLVQIMPL